MANRINKHIKSINSTIKKNVVKFNSQASTPTSFDEITDSNSLFFNDISYNQIPINRNPRISIVVKHQASELLAYTERCKEEKELVTEEMKSVMSWYKSQHAILLDLIENEYKDCQTARCALTKECLFYELSIQSLCKMFDQYIPIDKFSPSLQNSLLNTGTQEEDAFIQGIVSGALELEEN